jgi:hypothetical protein
MNNEIPEARIENGKLIIEADLQTLMFAFENNPHSQCKIIDQALFEKELLITLQNPLDMNQDAQGINAMQSFINNVQEHMLDNGCASIDLVEQWYDQHK